MQQEKQEQEQKKKQQKQTAEGQAGLESSRTEFGV